MSEGLPKFTTVSAEDARPLTPQELAVTPTVVPEGAEQGPELAQDIENAESRLSSNISKNDSLMEQAASRPFIDFGKIQSAYDTATKKINNLALMGLTASAAILASSIPVGNHSVDMQNSMNAAQMLDASQWQEAATKLSEGGIVAAVAVGGAWAIARTLNLMHKRAQERGK